MTSFNIGHLAIDRVEELFGPFQKPYEFFVGLPEDAIEKNIDWLAPDHYDVSSGACLQSVHSWIVRTAHHNVLIDTCCGNGKNRSGTIIHEMNTPWIERLATKGLRPEDIDVVMCTHLHVDHVGWNTKLLDGMWVPTFPNAKYVFGRREYEFWSSAESVANDALQKLVFEDSVLPCVESGQAQFVDDGYTVDDDLMVENAPGHTPGSIVIRAHGRGRTGLFTGDILHTALQVAYPDVNSVACQNPELSRVTRRRVLAECADRGHLLLPAHFGAPHFGRITRHGDSFRFHGGL
jgi:glyoxylase-like metal-dependent hydrolase (beta-lactamase superfamily II)